MKHFLYILLVLPTFLSAQVTEEIQEIDTDTTTVEYYFIEGDSTAYSSIDLDEVMLLHKLKFKNKQDRRRYYILRRKTLKVYPYAKLAAERLETLNERLAKLERRRDKKRYAKKVQKYIENEFSAKLKKFTRTEGQILIKLIHRQTGKTAFNLIKELRNGWRAFWYNNTASLFKISLKREFDPVNVEEDYLIEDILQRNFQSGKLERQDPAFDIDFFQLSDKWLKTDSITKKS